MAWLDGRQRDGGLDQIVVDDVATGVWLCGKHLIGPDPEAAVGRVGAPETTVVCLCEAPEIENRYPDYVGWLGDNEGTRSLWRPIPDLTAPALPDAVRLAAELIERLDAGHSLLVHCGAGMGRAPTVSMCALIGLGHHHEVLLQAVADCRPLAGPENGAQLDLVRTFSLDSL